MTDKDSFSHADLKQLQFTENVIKESMRLSPQAYASYRYVMSDQQLGNTLISDQTILFSHHT